MKNETPYVVVITAADGTLSARGMFASLTEAEGYAASLELATSGELSGQPVELEPAGK